MVATPLWLAFLPVLFRGWPALGDLSWQLADWLLGLFFTLTGLLLIGLPAASFIARRNFPAGIKAIALLAFGVAGGGLVAMLYLIILAGMGGTLGSGDFLALLGFAPFGFAPGFIVAAVWVAMNFTDLQTGKRHA